MKQKIIFFGTGDYTLSVIQSLKKFQLALVVTTEAHGKVEKYARSQNIPCIVSHLDNSEDVARIKELRPTIGVLASFGAIVPQHVIDLFPNGILNVHPSLLPKYKGPSPIQSAILAGDDKTGVTIIKLDDQIDHGPIAYQVSVRLTRHETTDELKRTLFKIGAELCEELIQGIEAGKKVSYEEQDHTKETFTEKFENDAGLVDVKNPPEREKLTRMIRALYPSPGVYTMVEIGGKEKRLKLLPKNRIQVEGKNIMTIDDFLNGYQEEGERIVTQLGLQPES